MEMTAAMTMSSGLREGRPIPLFKHRRPKLDESRKNIQSNIYIVIRNYGGCLLTNHAVSRLHLEMLLTEVIANVYACIRACLYCVHVPRFPEFRRYTL